MIGRTLGQYQIVEELGAGGMSIVYRATDTKLGRDVALKVLAPDRSVSDKDKARFLKEARALQVTLTENERCVIEKVPTTDIEAYNFYIRAMQR